MDTAKPKFSARCKGAFLRSWPFLILGVVAVLHILEVIEIDGYAIGLLVLAFLPIIAKTLTTYFESFKITKDGVEAKAYADNSGKTSEELEERHVAYNSQPQGETALPFSLDSRAILATLWHFQKKLFGAESPQRWGFGIGVGSRDFRVFQNGLAPLLERGLVHQDQRGLCYLTNEGVAFCKKHTAILDADGPAFTQFAPVPNS